MPVLCSFTAEMIEFIRSRIQMGDNCHRHGDKHTVTSGHAVGGRVFEASWNGLFNSALRTHI